MDSYTLRFLNHFANVNNDKKIYEKTQTSATSIKLQLSILSMSRFMHDYRLFIKNDYSNIRKVRSLNTDSKYDMDEDFEIVESKSSQKKNKKNKKKKRTTTRKC